MIYNSLSGRTRKDILEGIELACLSDRYDEELIFYLGKSYFWQKKYLYVFFEEDIVIRSSITYRNLWDKKF
ncbi:hypothetical protein GCM10022217_27320 [Chryseobacterium ginsenosidimutans]